MELERAGLQPSQAKPAEYIIGTVRINLGEQSIRSGVVRHGVSPTGVYAQIIPI